MPRVIFGIFVLLFATICARAQQPATPQQASLDGLIRACKAVSEELVAARELLEQQKRELVAAAESIAAEKAKSGAQQEKLQLLQDQVVSLQAAYDKLSESAKLRAEEVELLKKQLVALQGRLRLWKKVSTGLGAAVVIGIVAAGSKN